MTTIGNIKIPTSAKMKLHDVGFTYTLVAGSSAGFLLL